MKYKGDWVTITNGYYKGERARIITINSDGSLNLRIGDGEKKDISVLNVPEGHVK